MQLPVGLRWFLAWLSVFGGGVLLVIIVVLLVGLMLLAALDG